MDSTGIGNPKLLVLNPLRILARHHVDIMPNHQRISKMHLLSKAKHRRFSWCLIKKSSADVPQKNGLHHLNRWPQNSFRVRVFRCDFSLEGKEARQLFRNNKKSLRRFGAGLKSASIRIEVFLEKLQPSYTFWCELNSEMIWKMTWYSYVTVKICIFR